MSNIWTNILYFMSCIKQFNTEVKPKFRIVNDLRTKWTIETVRLRKNRSDCINRVLDPSRTSDKTIILLHHKYQGYITIFSYSKRNSCSKSRKILVCKCSGKGVYHNTIPQRTLIGRISYSTFWKWIMAHSS